MRTIRRVDIRGCCEPPSGIDETAEALLGGVDGTRGVAPHVVAQARDRGFHVAIEETGAAAAGEIDAIAHSHTLHFDGLILSAVGLDPRDERLAGGGYPIMMLGEQDFAARVVTRRYQGYLAALAERGLDPDPAALVTCDAMTLESGRHAAHRLVDSGHEIDAVVAVTDTVAQGVLRGLADRGVRVPGDVRLIGFDDIPEAAFMVPSLSTVAPEHRWMAAKAVELVTARIQDPSHPAGEYTAPFELMVRESTR